MSHSLPHLTLTTNTSSLSPMSPTSSFFSTVSPFTNKPYDSRPTKTLRCSTAEWQINTHPISHTCRVQPSGGRGIANVDGMVAAVLLGTWDGKDQRVLGGSDEGTPTCGLWRSSTMGGVSVLETSRIQCRATHVPAVAQWNPQTRARIDWSPRSAEGSRKGCGAQDAFRGAGGWAQMRRRSLG